MHIYRPQKQEIPIYFILLPNAPLTPYKDQAMLDVLSAKDAAWACLF